MRINLAEIKTPGIEIELKDGSVRRIDPFDIARRAEGRIRENMGLGDMIALFRELLELGSEDASDYCILYLQKACIELTKQLVVGKAEPPTPQS